MNFNPAASHEKATVLVVDDTPENIDVLRGVLKGDYKVKVAINGEQALKLCFSNSPPSLLLLDVMMPDMDGFEVCARLKADPKTEGIPVIFVTALHETCDELRGFDVGGVDFINKPVTPAIVLSRVQTHLKLRAAYTFIRQTFGRYLSEEIVDNLIDSPQGLELGGEKRELSIMMADLRGFTSIGERLPAETVVKMINIFLGRMTDVIQAHQGTIDEFIGDAILAIFGAPVERHDNALRAVRCAIDMQLAMQDVNRDFKLAGYPPVTMGIGINTGPVIVGNIGSQKRSKYGVVGRVVNTTSRIESYTVGGQVLIAQSTKDACGGSLKINGDMQVMPKGITEAMTIYDVGGILDENGLSLPEIAAEPLVELSVPISIQIAPLVGKHSSASFSGCISKLSLSSIEIDSDHICPPLSDLRVVLLNDDQTVISSSLYVKVLAQQSCKAGSYQAHVTSLPPEAELMFTTVLKQNPCL
ncbi:adenylate/guanylate cyclase domain-containing response regulator [Mariprofundus sp. EBB-1]|uniref:adenylate/guanylate cyclase domain-containing protein n=1 Tax=Mariprofundus sp. EBB-1 TaxID=2650971 RepID=UPI000EF19CE2|nr:adenylate/guanylate cyclase domain-containing protein [Mariprofundus sp. EBB-1]RLL55027.1 adenylate/guanylate cyclase domain-containing response regulator [Mariprofundus sp. EBB-1]